MSWDSSMKDLSPEQKAHIVFTRFACPDTKAGIKFSLGGVYVRPIVQYVSKSALKIIRNSIPGAIIPGKGVNYDTIVGLERLGITREHMIPVEDLFRYFDGLYRAKSLTEKDILAFIPKLEIAFISTEENKNFTGGLSKRMPDGWWNSETQDPLDRYRAAGLVDSIWVDWEEAAGSDSGPIANADTREQGRERGAPPFDQPTNNPRNHERRQAMPRDYTKYSLDGDTNGGKGYGKGPLVETVVRKYVEQNHPTFNELKHAFPDSLQGNTFCVVDQEAGRFYRSRPQYFFPHSVSLRDGSRAYICKEWSRSNIGAFIVQAKKLDYNIYIVN